MRRSIAIAAVVVLAVAHQSHAATLEEILTKNLAARGGEARLREVKALRLTGRLVFGGGDFSVDAAFGQVQKRGGATADLVRSEVTVQGLTQISAYDSREGWTISPFGGRLDAEKASADDARSLAQQAEIDGPLVGWRAKGHKIEYLGTEDTDGTPAIKLRVTRKDGDLQYVYLDPDSYLEIRITTVHKVRGAEQISETDLGGYQQVAGVWFPFALEQGSKGGPRNTRIIVERVEVNPTVDDAWFKLPPAKSRVAAVIAPGPAEPRTAAAAAPPPTPPGERATLDGGALSGLGARNVGSATMSGRISAVA
ncbi:MAG TPA: hypothetical protein VK607_06680, partial [Kofleriaceae bacterium]|nr:hypothetical protein [Kofleriaceae bacterium]